MKIILIQGAKNTGKTTLCNRIDEWLQREFIDEYFEENHEKIEKMVVTKDISLDTDFFALYDIKQIKNINHKRIIINSLSDEVNQFYKFKIKEDINLDYEKLPYAKDSKDLKERWRKVLKFSILSNYLIKEKEEDTKKEKDNNKKEIYKNIKEIYETKERCLKEIPDIPTSDIDTLKQKIKGFCDEIEQCLEKIPDIPTSDVDTLKQKIKGFCDEIIERISEPYTPSKMPDLLITAIRPSGTNFKKIIEILKLNDLEKINLSPKTIYSYQKDILLIKLEKTPLELIKEEIKKLFK